MSLFTSLDSTAEHTPADKIDERQCWVRFTHMSPSHLPPSLSQAPRERISAWDDEPHTVEFLKQADKVVGNQGTGGGEQDTSVPVMMMRASYEGKRDGKEARRKEDGS